MNYLLDTDWIINLLAGNKDAEEKIQHLDPEEIVISLATVGEIYEGACSYAHPQAHLYTFRQFLRHFQLLNLNLPIMETFAEIRAYLRRRGEPNSLTIKCFHDLFSLGLKRRRHLLSLHQMHLLHFPAHLAGNAYLTDGRGASPTCSQT